MFVAHWNGVEIARAASVVQVEGRLYFRPKDVRLDLLSPAPDRSVCEWKGGEAIYFDILTCGAINRAAAWSYPTLGAIARIVEGRFAFWRGVTVAWCGVGASPPIFVVEAKTPNVAKALDVNDVVWQPELPAAIVDPDEEPFAGYLIPSLRLLVNVIATPTATDLPARIAEARALAKRVVAWNHTGCEAPFAFIAVWGSATPAAATVALLRKHAVIIDLSDQLITLGHNPKPVRRFPSTTARWPGERESDSHISFRKSAARRRNDDQA